MKRSKQNTHTYNARTIHIKNKTPLASILNQWTLAACRLYNSATFLNRNTITGLLLPEKERHPNQQYAIDEIESILARQKKTRWKSTTRKLAKIANEVRKAIREKDTTQAEKKREEGKTKRKDITEALAQRCILNQHHRRANYNELDAYYKYTDNPDYRALPAHAAQNILREVNQAWDNWAIQLHDWRNGNSLGLKGKPGVPSYKERRTRKTIEIPAADIVIAEEEKQNTDGTRSKRVFAQLPLIGTEERIEITGAVPDDAKLAVVQIIPVCDGYDVVFVYKKAKPVRSSAPYLAGGDLGLDNLLTIVVNDGKTHPLIIDGKKLKSINHYWNKKIALLKSELPDSAHTSKAIKAAWTKRAAQLHDGLNQAANIAVEFLVAHDVREFVVGKNDGWKEDFAGRVPTRRRNKQDFVFMPYDYLLKRLEHKCAAVGIAFVCREESYTSKASLVDGDPIPSYGGVVPDGGYRFSGYRKSRGCYQSRATVIDGRGVVLNADVNGAGNILRKEHEGAFDGVRDWRFLMCPSRVRLLVVLVKEEGESPERRKKRKARRVKCRGRCGFSGIS